MGTLFATIITQATLMAGAAVLPDKGEVSATPPPIEQQASTESIQSSEDWNVQF
jgi:hypothetical protein